MGFFSQLGDIWDLSWDNYGFKKSFDLIGDAWDKTYDSAKLFASGLWGLALGATTEKKKLRDAYIEFNTKKDQAALGTLGALGDTVGAVTQLPFAKQFFGTAMWAQNEGIKRPFGTAALMAGDIARGRAAPFDQEKWQQAYNDTRTVSTGQAFVYAGAAMPGGPPDPFNTADPRKPEVQALYHTDTALKLTSGSIDAAADIFADPTLVGGKFAAAAKLKYISPALKTTAKLDKYVTDSTRYAKLKEFIKASPNAEVVRQRAFNNHVGGEKAAAALWSVRHDDELYDATFRAMNGDQEAWRLLTQKAPRIADLTGSMYANRTQATAASNMGRSAKADAIVDALRETKPQAFIDAINADQKVHVDAEKLVTAMRADKPSGMWAEAAAPGKGVLVGQSAPYLSLTSGWRTGLHNWTTFGPQVFRGSAIYPVLSRARYLMPSAKFTRLFDVNYQSSAGAFRANLERSPLTKPQVEEWVSRFGRQSSPEGRARIAASAEDDAFGTMAAKHGWNVGDVKNAIRAINTARGNNRRIFSNSRLYMPDVARRLAEKYIKEGRTAESDDLHFLADDMEQAIKRGDQPEAVHVILDEDLNNIFIPGKFRVDPQEPAMLSQMPELMPMVDWRTLDTALWWAKKGPLGERAYTVINAGGSLLDAVNTVWKISTLLRPGYVPRMLSDEVFRRGVLYGIAPILMSTSKGVANAGHNWTYKGRLMIDHYFRKRATQGFDSFESHEGQIVDEVSPLTDLQRQPIGGPYAPNPRAAELSAAPGSMLRQALEVTAGQKSFTKNALRQQLRLGHKSLNDVMAELGSKGFIEAVETKGKVTYYKSTVRRNELNLSRRRLDYPSYDRALADGVISVKDYLDAIESHAARGDLPKDVAELVQGRNDGTLAPKEKRDRVYQRRVLNRALDTVGRGAFTKAEWQQTFVDEIVAKHKGKPMGDLAPATVIDPMTGMSPDLPNGALDPTNPAHYFHLSNGKAVPPNGDALYDYIADNLDDLLKPRNVLHAYVTPGGNMNLSVARWDGAPTQAIKQTGGIRVAFTPPAKNSLKPFSPKVPQPTLYGPMRRSGVFDRVEVNVPGYGTASFDAGFEGADGRRYMAQTSSSGPQGAYVSQLTDTEFSRVLNETRGVREVAPTEELEHRAAWERAVNVQLYNDPVARMFMDGKSVDYVLNWMRREDDGRKYWGRMGPWQSRMMDQIYNVKAQVDTFLPDPASVAERRGGEFAATKGEAEGIATGGTTFDTATELRQAALGGQARYEDFTKLFPSRADMPAVHGGTMDIAVGGPFSNWFKKRVNQSFKVLSDLPADRLSRFPMFADRYTAHLETLAPIWFERYGAKGRVEPLRARDGQGRTPDDPNFDPLTSDFEPVSKGAAPKGGVVLPVEVLRGIQDVARTRALSDVKKYLYDSSSSLDLASAAKLFVPFSSAVGDSVLKWGVIAREQGVAPPVLKVWKIWTAPDRAGMVQDDEGNIKKWDGTQYVWYRITDPKTGETELLKDHKPKQEYVVFQLPDGINPETSSGAKMVQFFNKETANTFLGVPTAGPLVAYPMNNFALQHPAVAETEFVRTFILPFGPTSNKAKAFFPSNVRNTWGVLSGTTDTRNIGQAVMMTEYTRFALGERDKPPTMAEVQDTSKHLTYLQWASQFFGASTQFKSPYQPYIDYYHTLQQAADEDRKAGRTKGWETSTGEADYNPLARFYAEMGDEYRMMTASVTRNVAGLPASLESNTQIKKFQDLIALHPKLAPLIVGSEGAGSFSSAVYQAQLDQVLQPGSTTKMREVLSLQDSVADAERRYKWVKYGKMMDAIDADMLQQGLTSLSQKRAKDLKAVREKFISDNKYWTDPQGVQQVSPWFEEFATADRAAMTERLTSMADIVLDPRLGQRDDMRGLFDYLKVRMQVRAEMQQQGFATLDSKAAAGLQSKWDAYVTQLKEGNLAFADLHHRWLANDNLTVGFLLNGEEV